MFDSKQALVSIASESSLDKLIPTEALCRASYEEGHLRSVPEERREFITSPELILTAKRRLHHLGYLKNFSRDGALPADVRAAIRQFQTEAGIKVDGWIGEETWRVFDQLFSFEMDARLDEWLGSGATRLLHRAVQLRLFAFGLIPTPPSQRLVEPGPGLERFCSLAKRLNLSAAKLEPSLNSLLTLKLLFDQDGITEALARVDPGLVGKLDRPERDEVRRFLVCDAKIELWLMGYDVEPDGTANFKVPSARTGSKGQRERLHHISTGFYYALGRFCDDVRGGTERRLGARRFYEDFPGIFDEFTAIRRAGEPAEVGLDASSTLYETLEGQSQEAEKIWNERADSLGGRIWDGMKRAWGWLRRLVRRGLQRLGAFLMNAIRLAWNLARNSLGMIRAAFHAFPRSIEFLVHGETAGADVHSVVLRHDGDFDWKVFVAGESKADAVGEALATLSSRVLQFGFCTRILGLLVQALLIVGRYAATGYFALVMALVKIQKSLQQFMDYYLTHKTELLGVG